MTQPWKRMALGLVAATAAVVAGAFGLGCATPFGRGVAPAYFGVLAQVVPVIFLAIVVEAGTHTVPRAMELLKVKDRELDSAERDWLRLNQVIYGICGFWALLAESTSLCAVAANAATTFLLITATGATLLLFGTLMAVVVGRYSPS